MNSLILPDVRPLGLTRPAPIVLALSAIVVGLLLCSFPKAVAAAEPAAVSSQAVTLPDNLTREEVRDLLSRLSDDQVRQLLITQLDKVAIAETKPDAKDMPTVKDFMVVFATMSQRLNKMAAALPELPSVGRRLADYLTAGTGSDQLWLTLLLTAIVFGAGCIGEWIFRKLFRRLDDHPRSQGDERLIDKICILSLRLVMNLFAIGVFVLCAVGTFYAVYQGHEPTANLVGAVFWTIVITRVAAVLTRFAVSPSDASIRLPPINDATARMAFRRIVMIVALIAGAVYSRELLPPPGSPEGLDMLVGTIVGFVVLAVIVGIIWRDRRHIASLIMAQEGADAKSPNRFGQFFADNWHVLATCYIVGIWIFSTSERLMYGDADTGAAVISVALLVAIPFADWVLRGLINQALGLSRSSAGGRDAGEGDVGAEDRPVEVAYKKVLLRNLRIVLAVLALVLLARVWNVDMVDMMAAGIGETLAHSVFDIAMTVILASALWGIIKAALGKRAAETDADASEVGGEAGGKGGTRLDTILPLIRKFLLTTVIVIATLIVLSELGVDIGPLIAGAGIVGIAVGFGAQTLVSDIISGLFFLMDDAFRVGEYCEVGGNVRGTVEHISVRSLQLRHHRGPLNTIPFSKIAHLTNFSRDWAIMKLEVRVPFDTDMDKVRKLVKKVGQELLDHPEYGKSFIQPVKSQGVNRMDDSAFILRVKFMTLPGEQFTIRREVYNRIQEVFAANGIKFAPKRVIVDTGGDTSDRARAMAAAAAVSTEAGEGGGPSGGGGPGD